VRACLASGAAVVLDADALSVFADHPDELVGAIAERPERPVVMTPHEGEFARFFSWLGDLSGSKCDRAVRAAQAANAVVLLKGPDTVIAAPTGGPRSRPMRRPGSPPPEPATCSRGSCWGCWRQAWRPSMRPCMAVWLHGEAARDFGPGLIAEDLPGLACLARC
jgi:ADP-dependent NAD(P)H-hydrate dehydratase / NAD(P)H-hydrate epimerase